MGSEIVIFVEVSICIMNMEGNYEIDGELVVLGIESSCDDTSAAVLRGNRLLSNVIASQKVHEAYGGVVPELASRAHLRNVVPVVRHFGEPS